MSITIIVRFRTIRITIIRLILAGIIFSREVLLEILFLFKLLQELG